jgi:hypothetical protein
VHDKECLFNKGINIAFYKNLARVFVGLWFRRIKISPKKKGEGNERV